MSSFTPEFSSVSAPPARFRWELPLESVQRFLEDKRSQWALGGATVLLLIAASLAFHFRVAGTLPGREDVLISWNSGTDLAAGRNPYEPVLAGDMRDNKSYATYLPWFYVVSAACHKLGVTDFLTFLRLWRPVCELSHLGIAVFLLVVVTRGAGIAFGIFAALFWFFNRWTIAVVNIAHLDTLAILFLLLSLYLFPRRRLASLLLFGMSLAIKQMAVFLVPLYVIWAYTEARPGSRTKDAGRALGWLLIIPLAFSAPFLLWNAEAFIKSVLFSATRIAVTDFGVKSVDAALGLSGLPARLPMFALFFAIYLAALGRYLGRYSAALFVMATFLDFNSVLFYQYMVWAVPLLPLAALEWNEARDSIPADRQSGWSESRCGGSEIAVEANQVPERITR